MAAFHRAQNGIGYFTLTLSELCTLTRQLHPICDECLVTLNPEQKSLYIPVLNMAYCPRCGKKVLNTLSPISQHDAPIEQRRIATLQQYFNETEKPARTSREPK